MQKYKRPIIFFSVITVIIGVTAWLINDIIQSLNRSSSKIATMKSHELTRLSDAPSYLPDRKLPVDNSTAPAPTLEAYQNDYIALYRRGKSSEASRKINSALRDFADSLKYNPIKSATAATPKSDAKTLKSLAYQDQGYIFCLQGKYREGVQSLSEAIKIRPNYVQNYVNRGLAYEKLGDQKSAKADYLTAKSMSIRSDLEDDCITAPISLYQ